MRTTSAACPTCATTPPAAPAPARFCPRCGGPMVVGSGTRQRADTVPPRRGPVRAAAGAVALLALGVTVVPASVGGPSSPPGRTADGGPSAEVALPERSAGAVPRVGSPGDGPARAAGSGPRAGDADVSVDGRGLSCRPNRCDAWTRATTAEARSLVVGPVLVVLETDRAEGLDPVTGAQRWTLPATEAFPGDDLTHAAPFAFADGLLLHNLGRLALIDPTDGRMVWSVDLGPGWTDHALALDGVVVVTTSPRVRGRSQPLPTTALGLSVTDGSIRWERRILEGLSQPGGSPVADARPDDGGGAAVGTLLRATDGVIPVALDHRRIGGLHATDGRIVWEREGVLGRAAGATVVLRTPDGADVLVDAATGALRRDLGGEVTQVHAIGSLVAVTSPSSVAAPVGTDPVGTDPATTGRTWLLDREGRLLDERPGPPLGWTGVAGGGAFIAWADAGWVLLVRYDPAGDPGRSRRLPGRIGTWGADLLVGSEAGSDRVRVVGGDRRTTVAVRTDGPTEPPPNPSVAPAGTSLTLIGRTTVARDGDGLTVRTPGGMVRVDGGRQVVAVVDGRTVVVRGESGLLAIRPDRLGPVIASELPVQAP